MLWKRVVKTLYWITVGVATLVALIMELFGTGPIWLYWLLFFWFLVSIAVSDSDWYKRWSHDQARAAIREVMTNAALAGHALGPFEYANTIAGGYRAECRRCGKTALVSNKGLIYSLPGDGCPG